MGDTVRRIYLYIYLFLKPMKIDKYYVLKLPPQMKYKTHEAIPQKITFYPPLNTN